MVQTDESILLSTEARSLLELKIADNKERLEEQDSSEDEVCDLNIVFQGLYSSFHLPTFT